MPKNFRKTEKKLLDVLSYIYYNFIMYDIETTEEFDAWLHNLRDIRKGIGKGVLNAENKEI